MGRWDDNPLFNPRYAKRKLNDGARGGCNSTCPPIPEMGRYEAAGSPMSQTELMTPDLLESMDRAAYDILGQNQPRLIEQIKEAMGMGSTARDIEAFLVGKYGLKNLTVAMAVCAAYYIEKQGKQETTNDNFR